MPSSSGEPTTTVVTTTAAATAAPVSSLTLPNWEETAESLRVIDDPEDRAGALFDKLVSDGEGNGEAIVVDCDDSGGSDPQRRPLLEHAKFAAFLKVAASKWNLDLGDAAASAAARELLSSSDAAAKVPYDEATLPPIARADFVRALCGPDKNSDCGEVLDRLFETREAAEARRVEARRPLTTEEALEEAADAEQVYRDHGRRAGHVSNRSKLAFWTFAYVAINVVVLWAGAYTLDPAKAEKYGEAASRTVNATAYALNFNAALIVLVVARHFVTYFRLTWLRHVFFPYDAALDVHIYAGYAFLVLSIAHTVAGFIMIFSTKAKQQQMHQHSQQQAQNQAQEQAQQQQMQQAQQQQGQSPGFNLALITGIAMLVCMALAYLAAQFRRRWFNTFWYSHHLLIVMLALMCVHGTKDVLRSFQSIYWVMVPVAMYLLPRLVREFDCRRAHVKKVRVHADGGYLELQVAKPQGPRWNKLTAGMFCNINIPAVSLLEWHPMTMSTGTSDDYVGFVS